MAPYHFHGAGSVFFGAAMAGEAGHRALARRLQVPYFWQNDIFAVRFHHSCLAGGPCCWSFCLSRDDPLGFCNFPATCRLLPTFAVSFAALGWPAPGRHSLSDQGHHPVFAFWLHAHLVGDCVCDRQARPHLLTFSDPSLRGIGAEILALQVSAALFQLTKAMPPSIVCGSLRRGGRVVNGSRL